MIDSTDREDCRFRMPSGRDRSHGLRLHSNGIARSSMCIQGEEGIGKSVGSFGSSDYANDIWKVASFSIRRQLPSFSCDLRLGGINFSSSLVIFLIFL